MSARAFIVPDADKSTTNSSLESAGFGPSNLSVPLEDSGQTVTHWGCFVDLSDSDYTTWSAQLPGSAVSATDAPVTSSSYELLHYLAGHNGLRVSNRTWNLRTMFYDTIADLQAAAIPINGTRAIAGGQQFVWKSDSALSDNDLTIVLPTGHVGNGRWLEYEPGWISVFSETELRDLISAGLSHGDRISIQVEMTSMTTAITFSNLASIHIRGRGFDNTGRSNIQQTGSEYAIVLERCNRVIVEGLRFSGNCLGGVRISTAVSGSVTPSQCIVRNCRFSGSSSADYTGVYIDSSATDANNEFHAIERCSFFSCSTRCVRMNGSQQHRIKATDCVFQSSQEGIYCENGAYIIVRDSQFTSITDAGIQLGVLNGLLEMTNLRMETMGELIGLDGASSTFYGVHIKDITAGGNFSDTTKIFNIPGKGPVVLENVKLRSDNGVLPRIRTNGPTRSHGLVFRFTGAGGDTPQKPIALDPDIELVETGTVLDNNGTITYPKSRYNDIDNGKTAVSQGQTSFATGETDDLGNQTSSAGTRVRSGAIGFKLNTTQGAGSIATVFTYNGFSLKLTDNQDATFDVVISHSVEGNVISLSSQTLAKSTDYYSVFTYDRDSNIHSVDRGKCYIRIGSIEGASGNFDRIVVSEITESLVMGGTNFSGTLSELQKWDRAPLETEMLAFAG